VFFSHQLTTLKVTKVFIVNALLAIVTEDAQMEFREKALIKQKPRAGKRFIV